MVQSLEVTRLHYAVKEADSKQKLMRKLVGLGCTCSAEDEKWRTILDGVSLQVKRGEVMAIMGNSGCGKTSLLDIIACRQDTGSSVTLSGDVLIDGKARTLEMVRSSVGYVRQDDRLIAQLTVRETLEFVAALRLPADMLWSDKSAWVERVIQELALWHVVDQPVGSVEKRGISGGERRRVSIGVQMLLNPELLLLDEPTSGLDAFNAAQLTELLHQLSRSGRIILMTVHQPRAAIFHRFDKLMLLSAGGRTVYCGESKKTVLDYFSSVGYACPKLNNPADYLVDISTVDLHSDEKEATSRQRVDQLVEEFRQRTTAANVLMWSGPESDEGCVVESDTHNAGAQNALAAHRHTADVHMLPTGASPGMFRQFLILCWRAWLKELRSVGWQFQQLLAALWMSLEVGLIYFDIGQDQRGIRDRISVVYSSLAIYPFMVTLDTVAKLHSERRFFFYEIQDGMYSSGPFFFSKLLCELPFNLLAWVCFVPIFYWMANLKPDILSFVYTSLFVLLVVYVSRSAALAIATGIHKFQVAQFVANLAFTINIFTSGFILNLTSLNPGVHWTSYLGFVRWAIQGMAALQFRDIKFSCADAESNSTCIPTGQEALKFYALDEYTEVDSWYILGGMFIAWNLLTLVFLKFRSQRPEQI
ncbi:ATP-binding cassette sub-family G member 8-like [Sycon ciliatum]|uniref:ATP-binding cassette sub-family G member 8-like n=1 Tax=Sycon ciliatum TaxID=27933 RepID=UPI0031F71BE0